MGPKRKTWFLVVCKLLNLIKLEVQMIIKLTVELLQGKQRIQQFISQFATKE